MTETQSYKLKDVMSVAASAGIVVPAFNIPYLPMAEAVAKALSEYDTFALMEVARLEFTKFGAKSPTAVAAEFKKFANPRVTSLHLDHVPVIDEDNLRVDWRAYIEEGIAAGFNSVMIDGSRLPFEENIAVTAEVVSLAHPYGVLVEAELGSVMGHEAGPLPPYEELFATKAGFTRPDEAREFVEKTRVDWLSVSVGSVHGAISGAARDQAKIQAKIDIERLRKLREATGIPLVLHGGSGIQQSYIDDAIKNGIAKINVGTDIRQPYERVLADTGSVEKAQDAVVEVIGKIIREIYHIEGSAAKLLGLLAVNH
jgi:ketose-bisphosphate aldolase